LSFAARDSQQRSGPKFGEQMNDSWFYARSGGKAQGPISQEDLGRILAHEANPSDLFVWRQGMDDWATADQLAELDVCTRRAPPPVPQSPRRIDSPSIKSRPTENYVADIAEKRSIREPKIVARNLHPWRRFFARQLDTYVFALFFFVFLGLVFPSLFATSANQGRTQELLWNVIAIAAYVPFEIFCFYAFGNTFGKALYGIHVIENSGDALSLSVIAKRAARVWVAGWGLGIPIVTLFTLLSSYSTLKRMVKHHGIVPAIAGRLWARLADFAGFQSSWLGWGCWPCLGR
jgi:uncharacterized RDD family membrane protein YckC